MARSSPAEGSPASPAGTAPVAVGLHARVLDQLGTGICGGDLPSSSLLYIDQLADRYAVSRSVVREAVRVLASMGLVASRRRVGTQVLPPEQWNVYDPQVIRWRLASWDRMSQLRSLTELRSAVEPHAAQLAAARLGPAAAGELAGLAARMSAAGRHDDLEEFLRLDVEFHRQVLVGSGNEMFVKLHPLVAEVLAGRYQYDLMPRPPHHEALRLHTDVAAAVQRGDGDRAREAMVRIMERGMEEMRSIWEHSGAQPT